MTWPVGFFVMACLGRCRRPSTLYLPQGGTLMRYFSDRKAIPGWISRLAFEPGLVGAPAAFVAFANWLAVLQHGNQADRMCRAGSLGPAPRHALAPPGRLRRHLGRDSARPKRRRINERRPLRPLCFSW